MKRPPEEKANGRRVIPWWLKRLGLVRAELKTTCFPCSGEEGLRQCAELSAVSMVLLKEEIRKSLRRGGEKRVVTEVRGLMARFSAMDKKWKRNR
jgi:hypothetical protein